MSVNSVVCFAKVHRKTVCVFPSIFPCFDNIGDRSYVIHTAAPRAESILLIKQNAIRFCLPSQPSVQYSARDFICCTCQHWIHSILFTY